MQDQRKPFRGGFGCDARHTGHIMAVAKEVVSDGPSRSPRTGVLHVANIVNGRLGGTKRDNDALPIF